MQWLLFEYLVVIAVGFYADTFGEKPMIDPSQDEMVLQEGFALKIECFSSQALNKLKFSFPRYTFESPRSTHELSVAENGRLTFVRRKVVFLDTGWYGCAAEGVEIEDYYKNLNHTHEDIAWIYVYVKSSEPFADRYYTYPKTLITLADESTVVIPCRTTSPDLNVLLWEYFKEDGSKRKIWFDQNIGFIPEEERKSPGKIRFDPKIGFSMEEVVRENNISFWDCEVNGIKDRYTLLHSHATSPKPKMIPNAQELLIHEGNELRIECYGETDIQFMAPDFNRYDNYVRGGRKLSKYEILRHEQNKSTFLRPNVISEDTGWYGCTTKGIDKDIKHYYINYTRKEINWIYVYVEALSDRILVEDGYVTRCLTRGSIVIPCLPTSPNYKVILTHENQNYASTRMNENIRFDPKLGFVARQYPCKSLGEFLCTIDGSPNPFYVIVDHTMGSGVFDVYTSADDISSNDFRIIYTQFMLLTNEDLHLKCEMSTKWSKPSIPRWIIPSTASGEKIQHYTDSLNEWTTTISILNISNVKLSDGGEYFCEANQDGSIRQKSTKVLVLDREVTDYIELNQNESIHEFVRQESENIKCLVDFQSFWQSSIEWFDPSNESIEPTSDFDSVRDSFHIENRERDLLVIKNIKLHNAGVYRMDIKTENRTMIVKFVLVVHVPPIVALQNGTELYYVAPDEVFLARCDTFGSPMPNITWTFNKNASFLSGNNSSLVNLLNYDYMPFSETSAYSVSSMRTDIPGTLSCTACNLVNCSEASMRILISDGVGRFGIIEPKDIPFFGDDVVLTCSGSIDAFQNLSWDEKFHECYNNASGKTFRIEEYHTQFTIRRVLHLMNVTKCHRRSYSCSGLTMSNNIEIVFYNLDLNYPEKPYFSTINLNQARIPLNSKLGNEKRWTLTCSANGNPKPNVTWFKDNLPLKESPNQYLSPHANELTLLLDLRIKKVIRYTCRAGNRFGYIEDYIEFVIGDEDVPDNAILVVTIALVLIISIILVVWLIIRNHRRKVAKRKFKEGILKRFDQGALQYVQPSLGIADQAEILPYDENWEYPRNQLKFGTELFICGRIRRAFNTILRKILGSGAFGLVRKAQAKSIRPGETVTTVAVKMVRAVHRLDHMMALSRELKVLVHLGQHANIVNLLGACTKFIDYGELFVIVEFCRFGNLQDYLHRRRADFIDQIEVCTGEIIGPHYSTDLVDSASDAVDHRDDDSHTRDSSGIASSTGTRTPTADDRVSSNDSTDPDLQCKWQGDYMDVVLKPICTKDLLCWAWQVSRGMKYLGLRKVVHGDLAARNILLADNNVVKICDFGLSKTLHNDDRLKKQEHGPLPLKWMAIESIRDRVFLPKSDVWSFGIVLWEFFTLSQSPYPGIHPKDLYQKLCTGYRMDQPKYATKNIYRMMTNCWDADPAKRRSFSQLEHDIEELLDDRVKAYYMDLDAAYNELNDKSMKMMEKDYLTMNPSQIGAVSFSMAQEKVDFCTVTLDKSLNSECAETSFTPKDGGPSSSFS